MKVSKCCTAIPWNDTDICAECMEHADFEEYVENEGQGMNKKILKLIKSRLDEGEKKYGHENVETDGRNFIVEALEEILDCSVYVAAKLIEIQNIDKGWCLDCGEILPVCYCDTKGGKEGIYLEAQHESNT